MNQPTATAKVTSMRAQMPATANHVDAMRARFGVDCVNAHIKAGMAGQAGRFFASERGHVVGTPSPALFELLKAAEDVLKVDVTAREWPIQLSRWHKGAQPAYLTAKV